MRPGRQKTLTHRTDCNTLVKGLLMHRQKQAQQSAGANKWALATSSSRTRQDNPRTLPFPTAQQRGCCCKLPASRSTPSHGWRVLPKRLIGALPGLLLC